MHGEVWHRQGFVLDFREKLIKRDTLIGEKQSLALARHSRCTIAFPDGSKIRLGPQNEVAEIYPIDSDRWQLVNGTLSVNSIELAREMPLQVESVFGKVRAADAKFDLTSDGHLTVSQGEVEVSDFTSDVTRLKVVTAGETVFIGEMDSNPEEQLEAPSTD